MKKQNKFIIITFFFAAYAYTAYRYYQQVSAGGHSWKTGDWLINYQGGFIRRGAFGELAYRFSETSGIEILNLVYLLQLALLFSCLLFVLLIFFHSRRSTLEVMILFSPAFLLFPFYDLGGGFRKELLVFLVYLLFLRQLQKKKLGTPAVIAVLFLYAFSILSHELAALTVPFFLFATYIFHQEKIITTRKFVVIAASFLALTITGFAVSIAYPGYGAAEAVCGSLMQRGLPETICAGAVAALDTTMDHWVERVIDRILFRNYLFVYPAALFLAVLPFMFLDYNRPPRRVYALFALCAVIFLGPLFLAAIDWGRWIHVFAFLSSALVFTLSSLGYLAAKIKVHGLFIIFYSFFWSIPHCNGSNLQTGMGEFFSRNSLTLSRWAVALIERLF